MRSTLKTAPPAPEPRPEAGEGTAPEEIRHPCPIERPHFFYGQLLVDEDLEALVEWTRGRLRLGRWRHGWGVVCGLDVRCHPEDPSQVLVGPGYAVGPGGEDIRVCAETACDLGAVCREEPIPCEGFEIQPRPRRRLVDLYVRYQDRETAPRPDLRGVCKPSRVAEGFELVWHKVEDDVAGEDPWRELTQRWHAGLELIKDIQLLLAEGDEEGIRAELLSWMAGHPAHQFGFLKGWVESGDLDEHSLIDLLFWLIQDDRNALAACGCTTPLQGLGVPLARLCIEVGGVCRVTSIDPYPPYRRPIGSDCWPAPPGKVYLGRFIWHRPEEVCRALADLGVAVREIVDLVPPPSLDRLEEILRHDLFVGPGQHVDLLQFQLVTPPEICLPVGLRVVGFYVGPKASLTVSKSTRAAEAREGDLVPYGFAVENTGRMPLESVHLDDKTCEEFRPVVFHLEPGARQNVEGRCTVVDNGSGRFVNHVVAIGWTPQGEQVISDPATHFLEIAGAQPPSRADFTLIGMMQPSGMGQLNDNSWLYRRGIVTYEQFLSLSFEKFLEFFPVLRVLHEKGSAEPLVREWLAYGARLAELGLLTVDLVLEWEDERPLEDLAEELYGNLIEQEKKIRRTRIFLARAARRAGRKLREPKQRLVPKKKPSPPKRRPPARAKTAAADDLRSIGLDRRQATKLEQAGIRTFGDLAGAPLDKLREAFPRTDDGKFKTWKRKARARARAKE